MTWVHDADDSDVERTSGRGVELSKASHTTRGGPRARTVTRLTEMGVQPDEEGAYADEIEAGTLTD